jgi:acetyl esterase/lipase
MLVRQLLTFLAPLYLQWAAFDVLAGSEEIRLWPEAAPGSENWQQVESENSDLFPHRIIRNVVNPTLTPFLSDPEKNTGVAVIVAPGGGFKVLSIDTEGNQVAEWLRARGINAFVLKYRLDETAANDTLFKLELGWLFFWASLKGGDYPEIPESPAQHLAIEDAQIALRYVRENSAVWKLREDTIGILGFSAGGAVATGAAMRGRGTSRPDFVASVYGVPYTAEVPDNAPPLLVIATEDDPVIPLSLGKRLYSSWLDAGYTSALLVYPDGGHGFGMQQKGASSDQWIEDFYRWLVLGTNSDGGDKE